MKVQQIKLGENKYSYLLIGDDYKPIDLVTKYVKYLSGIQKKQNTIKTYCNGLKRFYIFLNEYHYSLENIGLYQMSEYVSWLITRKADGFMYIDHSIKHISNRTVNLYITIAINYLIFLYASDYLSKDVNEIFYKQINAKNKKYKNFLYHATKNSSVKTRRIKLKVKDERIKRLSNAEIELLLKSTTNIRDEFLLNVLLISGIRIGEALNLQHEDIVFDLNNGHKIKINSREDTNGLNSNKTGDRNIFINNEIIDLYDDYCYFLESKFGISSNFVFVKIHGANTGMPMSRADVYALFRSLKKKTGIDVHPHLFRSTNGSIAYETTKDIEYVRESLGHRQVQTTIEHYVFQTEMEKLEQFNKVQERLKEIKHNGK